MLWLMGLGLTEPGDEPGDIPATGTGGCAVRSTL